MKALIASGGRGTRLRPITHTQNKHLIPIANKPILHYAIEAAVGAGIKEIFIVHNADSNEVPDAIGDGSRWNVSIKYIPQEVPGGLSQVVALAEPYIGKDKFIFYLGDNMVVGGVRRFIDEFEKSDCHCYLTLAKVKDPERFGVPDIREGRIVAVEEKPARPKSSFAVAGIYLYDHHIFEAVKAIKPSARGELEISDAHQYLIDKGFKIGFTEITGWWKDTGKPADLLEANRLVLDNITSAMHGDVDAGSTIAGKVIIGKGSKIVKSVVRGPAIIGENCVIEDAYIGPFSAIGNNTTIRKSEVEYSIILRDCKILDVHIRLEGSILGNDVEVVEATGKPHVHRFMIGDQSRVEVGVMAAKETFETLLFSVSERVATVTINRPDKLNALNALTKSELQRVFTDLKTNSTVDVVIITGSGPKAFVAGTDIGELTSLNGVSGKEFSALGQAVFDLIENLGKPVIAAINGYALGGGCELALACHIRIASDNAKFGQPEVNLGIIPGYGGTQRLARLVGRGRAMEMILTGNHIDAQEALRIGLVNKIVPQDELMSTAMTIAKVICTKGQIAIRMALKAVNMTEETPQSEGQRLEASLFGVCCDSKDFREGTSAFLEKRPPVFKNT